MPERERGSERGRERPAGDAVRRRDEILQVMYWMRGEGLAQAVGAEELGRFLDARDAGRLPDDLRALEAAGLLAPSGETGRYTLSEEGSREAARRFADAFEGMTAQGHGACSDPLCDCHELGPEACKSGAHDPARTAG